MAEAEVGVTWVQGEQFVATALNSSGQIVFIAPGTVTWSTNGGVATINSEGIAIGTNPGSGSVTSPIRC